MNDLKNVIQNIKTNDDFIFDVDLSKYVTMRASGHISALYTPKNIEDLKYTIQELKNNDIDFFVLGKGSNVIVKNEGFKGVAIHIMDNFSNVEILEENGKYYVHAESGVKVPSLAQKLLKEGLSGFEFSAHIPSTIGGAIYMNAGAYGGEIKDICVSVVTLNVDTLEIETFKSDDCGFEYRKSHFMNDKHIILSGKFEVIKSSYDKIKAIMDENSIKRKQSQPYNLPSAGSTFKRPKDDFAGRLIEESGLKGFALGGAKVSEKHAGFIVNHDNATADDVLNLIEHVKKHVFEKTGVMLEEEVRIK